jgi:hypothetical protein
MPGRCSNRSVPKLFPPPEHSKPTDGEGRNARVRSRVEHDVVGEHDDTVARVLVVGRLGEFPAVSSNCPNWLISLELAKPAVC